MLERSGFAVALASDGVEARERLAEAPVDVVITDLEMPRMNGFELIQELRRATATRMLPVVVLTTRAGSKYLNLARWLGANHYVAKPVDEDAFVALVESLVSPAARS
jgi:chemosensory pili system protein ChpA (sensor histidine kinase/response regulator)